MAGPYICEYDVITDHRLVYKRYINKWRGVEAYQMTVREVVYSAVVLYSAILRVLMRTFGREKAR